jgi:glycolate oxidase FAD binding subunit
VIATNDSGALRLRYGSVRDLILGVTVVLANGTIARSGGKVVKNVAGYDLPKLLTGSMGTLAVVVEATFRAHPLPRASRTLSFRFSDFASANRFLLAVNDSTLVPTSMQLRAGSNADTVDICFDGIPQGIDAQSATAVALASSAPHQEISGEVWRKREELFVAGNNWCVAKLSVLPSRIADTCAAIARHRAQWNLVMQANGLGLVRLETDSLELLAFSFVELREAIRQIGGTLVLLDGAAKLRSGSDVYGTPGDAHPLMVRVKQLFDPNGILNRGRFVGGI